MMPNKIGTFIQYKFKKKITIETTDSVEVQSS